MSFFEFHTVFLLNAKLLHHSRPSVQFKIRVNRIKDDEFVQTYYSKVWRRNSKGCYNHRSSTSTRRY